MIENLQRIASLFGLTAEPPAVEADGSGVWQCSASTPPIAAGAIAPELVLTVEGLGATPRGGARGLSAGARAARCAHAPRDPQRPRAGSRLRPRGRRRGRGHRRRDGAARPLTYRQPGDESAVA